LQIPSELVTPQLILTVTRDCNLRCKSCPLDLKPEHLRLDTAKKALSIYKEKFDPPYHIRFFGGEPLLRFDLIKELVNKEDQFSFPTNGILLTPDIVSFAKEYPNLQTAVSHSGNINLLEQLPNLLIHVPILPDKAEYVVGHVASLLLEGITRFNFLPTLFVNWSDKQLDNLERALTVLSSLLNEWHGKSPIYVQNLETYNTTPLFNHGMVVDVNGEVYPSNAFLCKQFKSVRDQFSMGTVCSEINWSKAKEINWPALFAEVLEPEVYESTMQVNAILLSFVENLSKDFK